MMSERGHLARSSPAARHQQAIFNSLFNSLAYLHFAFVRAGCPRSGTHMNLNQVTIYSDRPVETVEFFEKLGLRRIVDSLPRYARLECPDGDATLSVNEFHSHTPINNIVLYFECKNLDDEVLRLKQLGLKLDEEPSDRPWLWRQAYLKDPNGNKICLFHAGENRKNPPWRVPQEPAR